jgi:hypothetical protein
VGDEDRDGIKTECNFIIENYKEGLIFRDECNYFYGDIYFYEINCYAPTM